MSEALESPQSHLFISYAVEDAVLARWIARKLAARGHPVWFDQMKLLGGEQWPQTIDEAIKNRTFRLLALISEHSLRKQKPTGERTLAQRIAEQRKIADFLIPLKVDGSELDWLTTGARFYEGHSGKLRPSGASFGALASNRAYAHMTVPKFRSHFA